MLCSLVRLFSNSVCHGSDSLESLSISTEIFKELKNLGHNVSYADNTHGGGQAIYIDRQSGTLIGGSDSRKDGLAIGY